MPHSERKNLDTGLEIGLDPQTRAAVRIKVEANLLTIARPRTGKTSGFIIPNLVRADKKAWDGPAVVIDPKGEIYQAVKRRREEMGKVVRCIDPLGYVGGQDRWNPLAHIMANDVLRLQSVARSLLPSTKQTSDTSEYFTSSAVNLLVAAFQITLRDGTADLVAAARLLAQPSSFRERLAGTDDAVSRAALAILDAENNTAMGIRTTAQLATQWLTDDRMQQSVSDHTFDMSDLTLGNVDLFIVPPADDRKKILAPYMRWLLAELFQTVREHRAAKRILVFIDEAFVLGPFDSLLSGLGELPGYGISLWTFWHSRSQIRELYGENGLDMFFSAEMLNTFEVPYQQVQDLDYWSKAIGDYTSRVQTTGFDQSGRRSTSIKAEAVPLVSSSNMSTFLNDWQIVFLSGRQGRSGPLKLRRTFADKDPRFAGLVDLVRPVGRS